MDIIHKFNLSGAKCRPFLVISFPLFGYCYIIIINMNVLIIISNKYLHICNGIGYNQHAHTHLSKIIRSE